MANEPFIRWQERTRAQFGQATNLVLTLAVGTLGFSITFVLRPGLTLSAPMRLAFDSSLLFSSLSVLSGIIVMYLRLTDARLTTRITRVRLKGGALVDKAARRDMKVPGFDKRANYKALLARPRRKVKRLGEKSWFWFDFQLLTFGAGAWFLVLSLIWKYHGWSL